MRYGRDVQQKITIRADKASPRTLMPRVRTAIATFCANAKRQQQTALVREKDMHRDAMMLLSMPRCAACRARRCASDVPALTPRAPMHADLQQMARCGCHDAQDERRACAVATRVMTRCQTTSIW